MLVVVDAAYFECVEADSDCPNMLRWFDRFSNLIRDPHLLQGLRAGGIKDRLRGLKTAPCRIYSIECVSAV